MGVWRQQKAIDRLEDRLRTLEIKADDMDRAGKKLDLEFTDLYDKVRRQMSRMAKRYAVDSKEAGDFEDVQANNIDSPSVDPISKSIMLRRAGGGLGK